MFQLGARDGYDSLQQAHVGVVDCHQILEACRLSIVAEARRVVKQLKYLSLCGGAAESVLFTGSHRRRRRLLLYHHVPNLSLNRGLDVRNLVVDGCEGGPTLEELLGELDKMRQIVQQVLLLRVAEICDIFLRCKGRIDNRV